MQHAFSFHWKASTLDRVFETNLLTEIRVCSDEDSEHAEKKTHR